MHPGAIAMLVAGGLLIAALAVYLLVVTVILFRVRSTLKTIIGGLQVIEQRTQQIGPALESVNEELAATEQTLAALPRPRRRRSPAKRR